MRLKCLSQIGSISQSRSNDFDIASHDVSNRSCPRLSATFAAGVRELDRTRSTEQREPTLYQPRPRLFDGPERKADVESFGGTPSRVVNRFS